MSDELTDLQQQSLINGVRLLQTVSVTPQIVWHEGNEYRWDGERYVLVASDSIPANEEKP